MEKEKKKEEKKKKKKKKEEEDNKKKKKKKKRRRRRRSWQLACGSKLTADLLDVKHEWYPLNHNIWLYDNEQTYLACNDTFIISTHTHTHKQTK